MLNKYTAFSKVLRNTLGLRQSPVAISFMDSVPVDMARPDTQVAAGCRFWQDAADKAFVTAASDHSLCAIGLHTHTFRTASLVDLQDALQVFGELGYVREEDIAAIPVLNKRSEYVAYSPLAETRFAPDVVLLFVNARQTLVLSEAVQQVEGGNPPAMGRPACAVVPQVRNTGRAALSLGCCGARAYLDVLTDDVAIFAMPGENLEAYVQRIEVLANANSVLTKFHSIRRHQVETGATPSIKDSLAIMA